MRGGARVVWASQEAVEDAEKKEEGRDRGKRGRSGETRRDGRERGRREEAEDRGGETRKARRRRSRRWRRKFTTRRPPKLPTLPRRLSALSSKSVSSCVHSPSACPLFLHLEEHLRNTLGTRVRVHDVSRLRYMSSAVTV